MTPAQRRWLRRAPAVAAALVLVVLVVRTADTPDFPDYEVPEGFVPAPPPTTATPGVALPALAAVPGTTTTVVPPNAGSARLAGLVAGPGGPVPGATVRLERFVGDTVQSVDVVAGADGRYDAAGIGGGRYRVRAFLPPAHTQPTGEVLFLRDGEDRPLDLRVESVGGARVRIAFAPEAPLVGDLVGVAVQATASTVDGDGVARTDPLPGATVELAATGGLAPSRPPVATTGSDGRATFTLTCSQDRPTRVQATVRPATAVPGTPPVTAAAEVPACVDPSTLTTTTTAPPAGEGPTTTTGP